MSSIPQLDGNLSLNESENSMSMSNNLSASKQSLLTPLLSQTTADKGSHKKKKKSNIALDLPTVASYNCRSLFPKLESLKIDLIERKIDCAMASEVWQQSENKEHSAKIEEMLEISGLKYISTSRPNNKRGGGVALIVNLEKYTCEKINIFVPNGLEVVWGLLQPKSNTAYFKKIIVCTFYSPPGSRRNSKLADYLVGTLQMLSTKYPEAGIIMGADRNGMDISPLLNCGLRLRQTVDKPTRQGKILDIIIMNLSKYYNSPLIAPPLSPDNPDTASPSDHSVPVAVPHTDRNNPPSRTFTYHTYRPLPNSGLQKFSQWISGEGWEHIMGGHVDPSVQVSEFEKVVNDKLNTFCPLKTVKLSSQDKPWINWELKRLHRLKSREYIKRGLSDKYKSLQKEFKIKSKTAAQKYLAKNTEALKETNPGQAYRILKKLGAQPGDCTDNHTFTLPSHSAANLTNQELLCCDKPRIFTA